MCFCFIFIYSACMAAFCQDRRVMAEADICGLASGKAGFGVECAISGHWSAGGAVEIGFGQFIKAVSTLETDHRQEFGDNLSRPVPDDLHKEHIYARYWPSEIMTGPYATAVISHGNVSGTDLGIGAGYIMHIWKFLNLYIEYRVGLKEVIGNDSFPVRGLSAGICLTFGKRP